MTTVAHTRGVAEGGPGRPEPRQNLADPDAALRREAGAIGLVLGFVAEVVVLVFLWLERKRPLPTTRPRAWVYPLALGCSAYFV